MEKFIDYLKTEYNPLAIVTYGSFTNGSNDETSDFDCLIIVDKKCQKHDATLIDGTPLDCFIYTKEEVAHEAIETFLTLFDGNIILDTDGVAAALKQRVKAYVFEHTVTPSDEKQWIIDWIRKTMHRAEKNDDEGNYRAVAFLEESLNDYCILRDRFYFGSKKALAFLKENDACGYRLYHQALLERTNAAIRKWADYVIHIH